MPVPEFPHLIDHQDVPPEALLIPRRKLRDPDLSRTLLQSLEVVPLRARPVRPELSQGRRELVLGEASRDLEKVVGERNDRVVRAGLAAENLRLVRDAGVGDAVGEHCGEEVRMEKEEMVRRTDWSCKKARSAARFLRGRGATHFILEGPVPKIKLRNLR